jgi:topoisomerase-4 subunit A
MLKKLKFDMDFADLAIKGRAAKGNTLTKHLVNKVTLKEEGTSTLSARKIWFDDTVQRINSEGRGELLGEFKATDKILTITQSGHYKLTGTNISTHFEEDLVIIEKWTPEKPISVVYFDGEKEDYYVKRFLIEDSDKKVLFITDHEKSHLEMASTDFNTVIDLSYVKPRGKDVKPNDQLNLKDFITVKGYKALGNKLSYDKIKSIDRLIEEVAAEAVGLTIEELNENPFDKPKEENETTEADLKGEDSIQKSNTELKSEETNVVYEEDIKDEDPPSINKSEPKKKDEPKIDPDAPQMELF